MNNDDNDIETKSFKLQQTLAFFWKVDRLKMSATWSKEYPKNIPTNPPIPENTESKSNPLTLTISRYSVEEYRIETCILLTNFPSGRFSSCIENGISIATNQRFWTNYIEKQKDFKITWKFLFFLCFMKKGNYHLWEIFCYNLQDIFSRRYNCYP